MPKIINAVFKSKAKAWTFEVKAIKLASRHLEAPSGQGVASRTTSLHHINFVLVQYML